MSTTTKLLKPLFVDGMFNRVGKCIRAKHVKTVSEYPLWIHNGKPDKDYVRNENDKYYLYVQVDSWLVPLGYTEYELGSRAAYEYMEREWYGGFIEREGFFDTLRKAEDADCLIKEQIAKEEAFCAEHHNNERIQAEFIKSIINKHIEMYIEARDNSGRFADFIGALFLGELDKCIEINEKLKVIRKQEEEKQRAELEEKRKQEAQEIAIAEQKAIAEAENILVNGGTINDGNIIVKIADKYGVNIPIRTRGWILNKLAECTITENGGVGYRYWKTKNATGSQKVYEVIFDIRDAINARQMQVQ